jgi:hypothetical protein
MENNEQFAIVALLGRAEYAGKVIEVEQYGAKLLRIDVPTVEKHGILRPGFTIIVNFQNSGYSLTPCDEETAKAHTWYHIPEAISPFILKNYLQAALPDPGGSRPSEQIVWDDSFGDELDHYEDDGDWDRYDDDDDDDDDDPESDELVPV